MSDSKRMDTRVRHVGMTITSKCKRMTIRAFGYIRCIEKERCRKEWRDSE